MKPNNSLTHERPRLSLLWGVLLLCLFPSLWSACDPKRLTEPVSEPVTERSTDAATQEKAPIQERGPDQDWSLRDDPFPAPTAPSSCSQPPLDNPKTLLACNKGKGAFGFWKLDSAGLPTYEYTLPHLDDPKAVYPHSSDKDKRDHMHQLGNDRVVGLAFNDGYVVLMGQERGVTFYNRFDKEKQQYAGGFSLIAEGSHVFNTAYRWRPTAAKTRRVFGLGYYQTITQHRGLRITHTIYAPHGDQPALIDHVSIENLTDTERTLRHYEYWDLNRHQASFQPIRTGSFGPRGDTARDQLNDPFVLKLQYDDKSIFASFALKPGETRPDKSSIQAVDTYPADVFLLSLDQAPADVFTDQAGFLGKGGINAPSAASNNAKGQRKASFDALDQPTLMVMKHDLTLAPKTKKILHFAFGYVPDGKDKASVVSTLQNDPKELRAFQETWKKKLVYVSAPDEPVLSRELLWKSYYLQSATNYLDYYKTHVTPQGSAYLYLHGFDGAPRDQALFSIPLSYLNPTLAKANLKLIMGLTNSKDGQISYSFHGYGVREAAVIHTSPSDLDIFFLLALSEYLTATGDKAFLTQNIPFHPKGSPPAPGAKGDSVLDHVRAAFTHLVDQVGLGENGLIRVRSGDWSDGVVRENVDKFDPDESIKYGESIPNTQMAIHVLPLIATHIETADAALAQKMREYVAKLLPAVKKQWTGQWFIRAWLRDKQNQPGKLGEKEMNLEGQPWGLIASDILDDAQKKSLVETIYKTLDEPSPIGPVLEAGGMVWPAIAQLITWAYTKSNPAYAWASFKRQTYAAHAEKWPDVWFGIWSGPDGMQSKDGLAWSSPVTPMSDWPVMNMNQDAMSLMGLLRIAGIEPGPKGLIIAPKEVPQALHIDFPLLRLKREQTSATGEYRAQNEGSTTLILRAPPGKTLTKATLKGKEQPLSTDKESASLQISFKAGEKINFGFQWQ